MRPDTAPHRFSLVHSQCAKTGLVLNSLLGQSAAPAEALDHLENCHHCQHEVAFTAEALEVFEAHLPTTVLLQLAVAKPMPVETRQTAEEHLSYCEQCKHDLSVLQDGARTRPAFQESFGAPAAPVADSMPRRRRYVASGLIVAAAAMLTAVLGLGAIEVLTVPTQRSAKNSADQVEASRLYSDGFESHDSEWHRLPSFSDGFESGNTALWASQSLSR